MTQMQEKAIAAIEAQQPKTRGKIWMVGEQLKDIVRAQPSCAELIEQDLANKEMGLAKCEEKLAAFAKANGGCVIPIEADRIIREFYGLPAIDDDQTQERDNVIDLAAFF